MSNTVKTVCDNPNCSAAGKCELTNRECPFFKNTCNRRNSTHRGQAVSVERHLQLPQQSIQPTEELSYNGFKIGQRLPSFNEYVNACRANPYVGAKLKKDTEYVIEFEIMLAKRNGSLKVPKPPVKITFVWHESNKRRDLDNIFSAKKYILDAMQKARVLENDSRKFIVGLTDEIVDDTADFVEVKIYEVN